MSWSSRWFPGINEASLAQKTLLLDAFVAFTGYACNYAIRLLSHATEVKHTLQRPRPPHYGPVVQQVLFLAWRAANQICAKRLIPSYLLWSKRLLRYGHFHLTEECRNQLLSMNAATADRFLRSQRKAGLRGLSTTRAGTLLKNQIQTGTLPDERSVPDPVAVLHPRYREHERRKRVLGWRRAYKDPFAGDWEQIISWLVANPEREPRRHLPGVAAPLSRTLPPNAHPHPQAEECARSETTRFANL
jgi:hypothetical protein